MRCIFCKADSTASLSKEHVVPESLGNIGQTLPRGVVCDSCNNYFAREIEKPFLESPSIARSRFNLGIANKEGRIPPITGILTPGFIEVNLTQPPDSGIYPVRKTDFDRMVEGIIRNGRGAIRVFANPPEASAYVESRFICKVAIEALAYRLRKIPDALDEIIDKAELDPMRRFCRVGNPAGTPWGYHKRRIYEEDATFTEDEGHYIVLHEYTFIQSPKDETFFVLGLFGIEYAISLDRPEIVGYQEWLVANNGTSPLQP